MVTAPLKHEEELPEVWWESDPSVRVRADFPLSAAKGADDTAVVYFELDPGCKLGRHTDSAEEVLLILQGTVEVTVGDEQGTVSAGELALVPEMVPHSVRNVGEIPAKVAGFFNRGHVISTFDEPYVPINQQVFEM